ncbi:MAG: HAMP domain-containing histidine kinase [Bacillota bacterium]|nr:HAMP domain-containing histidine kinase [Bacillota bacterium]
MGKLTLRLIKYFIAIISFVIIICFISSSIFLSYIYTNMEYSQLETAANKIYEAMKKGQEYSDIVSEYQITSAFLIKDKEITVLTSAKMGIMSMTKNVDINNLPQKGKYVSSNKEELLYYKKSSDMGDIVIIRNNRFSNAFLKAMYIILSVIFLIALLIAIPIVALLGKKITNPIIKLEKASLDITQGNFDIDVDVNTKDEIEQLSKSLKIMANTIEKKNDLQRDFIANVSHDFKTPLSVIRNYSEAIYDDILDEKGKKEYLKGIIKEVDRLNYLVMDILQLSKLQGGGDIFKKEHFNISEFLLSFKNSFNIQMQQKKLNFNIVIPASNIEMYGDERYLYRVIYNFIENAIKFTGEFGFIELYGKEIGEEIQIGVKDNGIGIDEKYLVDIWQRYYKNKISGGMGLGLAICSEILNLHGFKYGVSSEVGKGTEFYFRGRFSKM